MVTDLGGHDCIMYNPVSGPNTWEMLTRYFRRIWPGLVVEDVEPDEKLFYKDAAAQAQSDTDDFDPASNEYVLIINGPNELTIVVGTYDDWAKQRESDIKQTLASNWCF